MSKQLNELVDEAWWEAFEANSKALSATQKYNHLKAKLEEENCGHCQHTTQTETQNPRT